MRKLYYSVAVIAVLALCSFGASSAFTQGYKGLIAPDNSSGSSGSSADPQGDGYKGLMAPSTGTTGQQNQPSGYRGLIPGYVAPPGQETEPQQTVTPAPAPHVHHTRKSSTSPDDKPEMTYKPGFEPHHHHITAEELRQIATLTGMEIHLDALPQDMVKAIHMPPHTFSLISQPMARVDGMLPVEFSAKKMIDTTMEKVNNQNLSREERKQVISNALLTLGNFAMAMRVRSGTPTEIYEAMGVPPLYVKEDREGSGNAAKRLQEALNALREMEQ